MRRRVFSASWNEKTGSLRLTGTSLIAINILSEFPANYFEYKDIQMKSCQKKLFHQFKI